MNKGRSVYTHIAPIKPKFSKEQLYGALSNGDTLRGKSWNLSKLSAKLVGLGVDMDNIMGVIKYLVQNDIIFGNPKGYAVPHIEISRFQAEDSAA